MLAEIADVQCAGSTYATEVSVMNSYLQSQEYTKYFFSDFDSPVRPLPAGGVFLTMERRLDRDFHLLGSLSAPLREEIVRYADGSSKNYYFPKILSGGVDWNAFTVRLPEGTCVEHRVTGGIGTALSHRFGKLIAPFLLLRVRINITSTTGLNIGSGYSGNIRQGAFFFPIGFSYRF